MTSPLSFLTCVLLVLALPGSAGMAQTVAVGAGDRISSIAAGLKPKKIILSVGIDKFSDPVWPSLRFTRTDAKNMHEYFINDAPRYDRGFLLDNPTGTSRKEIWEALTRIKAENKNEDDVVVLYFSTHGTIAYKENGKVGRYIVTTDSSSQKMAASSVDYDELVDFFNSMKSRKKVLVLAFCHSGIGKSALTPDMKRTLATLKSAYFEEPVQERSEGTLILTASGWNEPAIEDDRLNADVYTHYLMEGFLKDANGDGAVTITEAHSYATQQTYLHTGGRQRPSAIVELLGSDPIFVKGDASKTKGGMLYSLARRYSNLMVSVNGQPKGTLAEGVSIPVGRVKLQFMDEKGNLIAARVVKVKDGQEFSVADLLVPRLPNTLMVGAFTHALRNAAVRESYAPKNISGAKVKYLRDEALSVYDVGFALSISQSQRERIHIDGADFSQKRQIGFINMLIGMRERIGFLSSTGSGFSTEAAFAGGPGVYYYHRELEEESVAQKQVVNVAPSLTGTLGLQTTLPYYLLRFGIDAEVGLIAKLTDKSGSADSATSYSFTLGTFW